jgi:hypothetical protein
MFNSKQHTACAHSDGTVAVLAVDTGRLLPLDAGLLPRIGLLQSVGTGWSQSISFN